MANRPFVLARMFYKLINRIVETEMVDKLRDRVSDLTMVDAILEHLSIIVFQKGF